MNFYMMMLFYMDTLAIEKIFSYHSYLLAYICLYRYMLFFTFLPVIIISDNSSRTTVYFLSHICSVELTLLMLLWKRVSSLPSRVVP